MCAIPHFHADSLWTCLFFSLFLCFAAKGGLRKENTYEKVNHHHPRNHYDTIHRTESERRSTARDRRKNATNGDNGAGGASTRNKRILAFHFIEGFTEKQFPSREEMISFCLHVVNGGYKIQ